MSQVLILGQCEWFQAESGSWYRSTGLTADAYNSLDDFSKEFIWRRCGFERTPSISSLQGHANVLFRIRPGEPPDGQQPEGEPPPPPPPPSEDCEPHRIPIGSIVEFVGVAGEEWIVTNLFGFDFDCMPLYRLANWPGATRILTSVRQDSLIITIPPGQFGLHDRIDTAERNIRNDISQNRKEIEDSAGRTTADVRAGLEATDSKITAVPTATAKSVEPLIVDLETRLEQLISGLPTPDISDLLGLVPGLTLFVASPLEFLLTQGGSISQEVLDSVRS